MTLRNPVILTNQNTPTDSILLKFGRVSTFWRGGGGDTELSGLFFGVYKKYQDLLIIEIKKQVIFHRLGGVDKSTRRNIRFMISAIDQLTHMYIQELLTKEKLTEIDSLISTDPVDCTWKMVHRVLKNPGSTTESSRFREASTVVVGNWYRYVRKLLKVNNKPFSNSEIEGYNYPVTTGNFWTNPFQLHVHREIASIGVVQSDSMGDGIRIERLVKEIPEESTLELCDHSWQYTGTDRGGSHKGEDHYKCIKCPETKYEVGR